jgi:uncharacterized protein (DUF779 family)
MSQHAVHDPRPIVRATARAEATVERVKGEGRTDLVMVLGTGCCDSTAPFLYDHYYPGPDVVRAGQVVGVPVFAHEWLARLYGEGELVVDVDEGLPNDSFSLESEFDCRFTLRTDVRAADGPGGAEQAG